MEVRFNASVNFPMVRLRPQPAQLAAVQLMDKLAPDMVKATKAAVVMFGAERGGRTVASIRERNVSGRGVSTASTVLRKQVIGDRGLRAMIRGRKAGRDMPARQVGSGPRGGKVFQPVPEMLKWFRELNIPKSSWFPIMRAIARRGVKPKNVPQRAVDLARTSIRTHSRMAGLQIARGIISRAP